MRLLLVALPCVLLLGCSSGKADKRIQQIDLKEAEERARQKTMAEFEARAAREQAELARLEDVRRRAVEEGARLEAEEAEKERLRVQAQQEERAAGDRVAEAKRAHGRYAGKTQAILDGFVRIAGELRSGLKLSAFALRLQEIGFEFEKWTMELSAHERQYPSAQFLSIAMGCYLQARAFWEETENKNAKSYWFAGSLLSLELSKARTAIEMANQCLRFQDRPPVVCRMCSGSTQIVCAHCTGTGQCPLCLGRGCRGCQNGICPACSGNKSFACPGCHVLRSSQSFRMGDQ